MNSAPWFMPSSALALFQLIQVKTTGAQMINYAGFGDSLYLNSFIYFFTLKIQRPNLRESSLETHEENASNQVQKYCQV